MEFTCTRGDIDSFVLQEKLLRL